jgi:hypothetical protein
VVIVTATPASVTENQVSADKMTQPAPSIAASPTPIPLADTPISVTTTVATPTATITSKPTAITPQSTESLAVTPTVPLTSSLDGSLPPGAISWDLASNHIGEETTVCGQVIDANFAESSSGQPTFLNIGGKYVDPHRFTVVIWGRDRDKFPEDPAQHYLGLTICVSGTIEEYKGIPEIIVLEPEQIEIYY